MNMTKALALYKSRPEFREVFRSLGYGLRPNTLIGLLEDGRWYKFEFVAEEDKWLIRIFEIPKPCRHTLNLLDQFNDKHFLN